MKQAGPRSKKIDLQNRSKPAKPQSVDDIILTQRPDSNEI
jgi:hypothetical protein